MKEYFSAVPVLYIHVHAVGYLCLNIAVCLALFTKLLS